MQKETTGTEEGLEIVDSGFSLETPEEADVRVSAMIGQIAENNAAAEVAEVADIEAVQPQIDEIRQALGVPTNEVPAEIPPTAELDIDRAHEEALLINEAVNSGRITDMEKLRKSENIDSAVARLREEKMGRQGSPEAPTVAERTPVPQMTVSAENTTASPSENPELADALEYVGGSNDKSYGGILRAWKEKRLKNEEGLKKYKWGAIGGGAATLAAGVGASAAGYAAVGVGLAFGAPAVLVGGGALWAGKKLFNKWKERKVSKQLSLHPEDLE